MRFFRKKKFFSVPFKMYCTLISYFLTRFILMKLWFVAVGHPHCQSDSQFGMEKLSFECGIRIWHSWEALFDMSCRALFVLLISDLLCEPYGKTRAYCDNVIWFQSSRQDIGLPTGWKPSSIGSPAGWDTTTEPKPNRSLDPNWWVWENKGSCDVVYKWLNLTHLTQSSSSKSSGDDKGAN